MLPSIDDEISVAHPPYDSPSARYRFRNHLPERRRWLRVLEHLIPDTRLLDRFRACGSEAYVERNVDTGDYRVRSSACKLRVCPACQHIHQERVYRRLADEFEGTNPHDLKFITLTMKHSGCPLPEQLQNLRSAFRRLRSRRLWKSNVTSGFGVIELTFSERDNSWHPHLHILCRSTYIPHYALRKAWLACTKTSMIVDIRPVRNRERAAEYICKYVAKLPPLCELDNPDYRYAELFIALYNGHLLITFGSVRPNESTWKPDDGAPGAWLPVCKLAELLREARSGAQSAWDILSQLLPHDPAWIRENILIPPPTSHPPRSPPFSSSLSATI